MNEAMYSWWISLHCHFYAIQHKWFQPEIFACHWQWQHYMLKSTKGWYKAFWIIIRVFEQILSITSASNLNIDAIHWWTLIESNFYLHACQKCNFHQGWFLDDSFEIGVTFNAFIWRPRITWTSMKNEFVNSSIKVDNSAFTSLQLFKEQLW